MVVMQYANVMRMHDTQLKVFTKKITQSYIEAFQNKYYFISIFSLMIFFILRVIKVFFLV